jgi:hypothetical protein
VERPSSARTPHRETAEQLCRSEQEAVLDDVLVVLCITDGQRQVEAGPPAQLFGDIDGRRKG